MCENKITIIPLLLWKENSHLKVRINFQKSFFKRDQTKINVIEKGNNIYVKPSTYVLDQRNLQSMSTLAISSFSRATLRVRETKASEVHGDGDDDTGVEI